AGHLGGGRPGTRLLGAGLLGTGRLGLRRRRDGRFRPGGRGLVGGRGVLRGRRPRRYRRLGGRLLPDDGLRRLARGLVGRGRPPEQDLVRGEVGIGRRGIEEVPLEQRV